MSKTRVIKDQVHMDLMQVSAWAATLGKFIVEKGSEYPDVVEWIMDKMMIAGTKLAKGVTQECPDDKVIGANWKGKLDPKEFAESVIEAAHKFLDK